MKDWAAVQTFKSGVFPDVLAINSTGAATQDGTEYIAEQINNGMFGWMQDFMDYAGLTPDGVTEAAGVSQLRTAIQLGNGIGPGLRAPWSKFDDPSVTGDRVLLLSNQGVLIASFGDLVSATYVGDGNNATAPFFYKSVLADGVTRDTSGPFFILPNGNLTNETVYYKDEKSSGTDAGTFTSGAWQTRTLQTETGEILGASLASDQFTLPAGTYSIKSSATAYRVDGHTTKLRNITDAADEIIGGAIQSSETDTTTPESLISGTFTINASKTFEIQHQCQSTKTGNGFGINNNFSVVEIYTQVKITKLDSYPWGITF